MVGENPGESEPSDIMAQDRIGLIGTKNEFRQHVQEFPKWIESIPDEMLDHAYAEDKWTIRVLLGHIIDSHIVILYRLLSITRGDKNPLPGGNQDLWASFSGYEKAGTDDFVQGYRKAANISEWIVNWIPEIAMENRGIANGFSVSVRDLHVYLIAHERHHKRIAEEKYGIKSKCGS